MKKALAWLFVIAFLAGIFIWARHQAKIGRSNKRPNLTVCLSTAVSKADSLGKFLEIQLKNWYPEKNQTESFKAVRFVKNPKEAYLFLDFKFVPGKKSRKETEAVSRAIIYWQVKEKTDSMVFSIPPKKIKKRRRIWYLPQKFNSGYIYASEFFDRLKKDIEKQIQ